MSVRGTDQKDQHENRSDDIDNFSAHSNHPRSWIRNILSYLPHENKRQETQGVSASRFKLSYPGIGQGPFEAFLSGEKIKMKGGNIFEARI